MNNNKPRVIQSYEKLSREIQEQIKLFYSEGYSEHLIEFTNHKGELVCALPFESEDKMYMVRMSVSKAERLVEADDDFDDDGILKVGMREKYEDKYAELENVEDESQVDDYDD